MPEKNKKQIIEDIINSKKEIFDKYKVTFLDENAKVNLISKNDEKFLYEKHIFDSLAICLFNKLKPNTKLLDIGTGGGFPSVPLAICYESIHIYALDSIGKKIKAIENINTKLKLKNLDTICDRVENIKEEFDYVTSRAVASLDKILQLAAPKLKKGGYFIAYKSIKVEEEIKQAEKLFKKLGVKLTDIIEYELPLEESFKRNLVVFKKA